MKHIKQFNENNNTELSQSEINEMMKRAVEYDEYINKTDEILSEIISTQIEPLLKNGEFDEAKEMVWNFYKPARRKRDNDGSLGDVVLIGYNMAFARINKLKMNIKKYNL